MEFANFSFLLLVIAVFAAQAAPSTDPEINSSGDITNSSETGGELTRKPDDDVNITVDKPVLDLLPQLNKLIKDLEALVPNATLYDALNVIERDLGVNSFLSSALKFILSKIPFDAKTLIQILKSLASALLKGAGISPAEIIGLLSKIVPLPMPIPKH